MQAAVKPTAMGVKQFAQGLDMVLVYYVGADGYISLCFIYFEA
jgi:hypothetical protein